MKKILYILLLIGGVANGQTQPNYTGSGVITNKNTGFVGDAQTPDGMGIIHVTRSSAGGNKAYIGMTRNTAAAIAMGISTTNNFIIGSGPLRNSSAIIDSVTFEHNVNSGLTRINKSNGVNLFQISALGYMKSILPAYASGTKLFAVYNSTNDRYETVTNAQVISDLGTPSMLRIAGSGTGAATTISIAHGLSGITSASIALVQPINAASAGISYITTDATNINIIYTVAPASGTNNLSYNLSIKP